MSCAVILVFNSSDTLGMDDLQKVRVATWVVRVDWHNVGLALGLPVDTLEVIKNEQRENCDKCYTQALQVWLRGANPRPSWNALCSALKSPTVGYELLAKELSKEH